MDIQLNSDRKERLLRSEETLHRSVSDGAGRNRKYLTGNGNADRKRQRRLLFVSLSHDIVFERRDGLSERWLHREEAGGEQPTQTERLV